MTRVNRGEWPVPLPVGVSLNQVRQELLRFGGRYIWLDILCLRQSYPEGFGSSKQITVEKIQKLEQTRQQEWKLDVPTIGNVYQIATNIVR